MECRAEAGDHPDKRRESRHRTFLRGRVEFNNRLSSLDCTIRDLSDGGARLELAGTFALPEAFSLVVLAKSQTRAAYVRWRTATHVGISFARPASVSQPVEAMLEQRLKELEAENTELRRQLAELRAASADDERMAI